MNQTQPQPAVPTISLDFAGDIVALERLRALYVNGRPVQLDHTEAWLVQLIGQKAMMQVHILEEASTKEAIRRGYGVGLEVVK